MTIAAMLLVNNPGTWAHVYGPLQHAEWHGCTLTDLIFPFFLFIVGVSMVFSFAKRSQRETPGELHRDILKRSAIILALGLLLSLYPLFDFANLRYVGVLQRIAIVYLLASLLFLNLSRQALAWVTAGLLVGYWLLMTKVPVPEHGAGVLTPEGNFAAWLDGHLVPGRMYQGTWDPEGFVSTMPAIATTLLGIFTGEWLRSGRQRSRIALGLAAAGCLTAAAGLLWGVVFPINKNLWTSSYVLYTAGLAMVVLAGCYWWIDIKGHRRWAAPFVVFGVNAIAAYVLSGLVARTLLFTTVNAPGEPAPLQTWIFERLFEPLASPINASLIYAIVQVLLIWVVMLVLFRRRIFIKV